MAAISRKDNFIETLGHQILVCDGAIGTELRKRIPLHLQCVDACNISTEHAEKVARVHRAYADAGADVIQTNTYQANSEALAIHGLAEQVGEINRNGVRLGTCRRAGDLLRSRLRGADSFPNLRYDTPLNEGNPTHFQGADGCPC